MSLIEGGLIVAGLANSLLGLAVFIRDKKLASHITFLLLCLSVAFWNWGIAAFLLSSSLDWALAFANLYYLAALGIGASLLLFVLSWTGKKKLTAAYIRQAIIIFSWTAVVVVMPTAIVKDFYFNSSGAKIANFNFIGQALYSLLFLYLFSRAIQVLLARARTTTGRERSQIAYILLGVISAGIVGVLFNLVLPWFGVYQYVWIGPISSVFFVGFVGYSIAKHKLFNLRATVARSLAYLLAIGSMIAVYSAVVVLLSSTNIVATNLTFLQRVSFALIAVASGFLYTPFRRFFDKGTNRLFYRDAYDPQVFISELNQALVTNVEPEALLTKSALLIQENLKVQFCTFYIRETAYFSARIFGAHRKSPEIDDLEEVQELSSKIHRKVITIHDDDTDENYQKLVKLLKKNDIEVMARIVTTLEYEVKGIGYFFLGAKKSGSPFSLQDTKIIEIIANELVIAIENVLRFEEIEQFNVTLQKKIDDATKELQASNDKLRALDEAKDEFVSMASHQLRTPLTSIKGYLSMVLEGDAGKINDTQREMLGQAFFSSQRMVYLIADLLNVSRLKTGKFIIETKPVYLPDIVDDEIGQLQEGAKAKNLTLSFVKPKQFTTLLLDEMKIRQVVMNFTDNAIYYTPSGGKITIQLKETPKTVEFTVADNGIGVPKDQQPKLFTKFYRADNARKARPDGTGLGLFMAKKVVIAQGGSIIFASKVGKGSTFGFSFPKEKLRVEPTKPTE